MVIIPASDANMHECKVCSYCSAMAVFSSCSSTAFYVLISFVECFLYLTVTSIFMETAPCDRECIFPFLFVIFEAYYC